MFPDNEKDSYAVELHRKCIVVDAHCDAILGLMSDSPDPVFRSSTKRTLGEQSNIGHIDIPRMLKGGIDVEVFAIWIEPIFASNLSSKRALQCLDVFFSELEKNHDKIALARNYNDVITNHKEGKISALLSLEGGEAIDGDIRILRMMYRIGVRIVTLVWNNRNKIADGINEARSKGGLTNFGVQVVEEMNKLGMIIDVSHLSDQGFWDVLEVSKHPVIASHSNCRSLCDVPRNLSDDMIKALAEKGGVIGVNFVPCFLSKDNNATVETVVDHIDHIVETVGVNHVGLGSDFEGVEKMAKGLEDASKLPNLTKVLVSRGYSDQEIEKILGGNFLRIFREILK